MFQLISNYPRYAKVIGMGFKSGRTLGTADDLAAAAKAASTPRIPAPHNSASNARAANLENTSQRLVQESAQIGKVADRYSKYRGFDTDEAGVMFNEAQKLGKWTNPYLSTAESITKPALRLAGGAMMHPAGQTALYMGLPMMMMSGGGGSEELPTEYYQQQPMDGYAPMPMAIPPQMSAPMMASSALDEEQIRRARKRAEEQAALQQFYAQALSQYGGS